jgi:hypothetical protein
MPRNKTRAIEDIDISIALANFWISPLIDQCKLNDIEAWACSFSSSSHNTCDFNHEINAQNGTCLYREYNPALKMHAVCSDG